MGPVHIYTPGVIGGAMDNDVRQLVRVTIQLVQVLVGLLTLATAIIKKEEGIK